MYSEEAQNSKTVHRTATSNISTISVARASPTSRGIKIIKQIVGFLKFLQQIVKKAVLAPPRCAHNVVCDWTPKDFPPLKGYMVIAAAICVFNNSNPDTLTQQCSSLFGPIED